MKSKVRILSGILGATMLFPCIGVRANNECSSEVEIIVQKIEKDIEKNVGVMSLNTEGAWEIYSELAEVYDRCLLNKIGLNKFRNVLQKLEQNVKRMPIIDLKLMKAIYVLRNCYDARIEECSTNYLAAYAKWKETYEVCSLLNSTMKNTRYSNILNGIIECCKCSMNVNRLKEISFSNYYKGFFVNAVDKLEKMYEKPLEERSEEEICVINNLERVIIYELLEPKRMFETVRVRLPLDEFMMSLTWCSSSMEEYTIIFRHKSGKFLEFIDKLKKEANRFIKCGDYFKEHAEYSKAMECYFTAKVLLDYSGQYSYPQLMYRIGKCEKCMKELGEGAFF